MKFLPLVTAFALILLPSVVSAQGFVPCNGTDCDACHFLEMGQLILFWLIGILAVVFAAIALVAGWGLVTSGGNTQALSQAKSRMANAVIGFILVLAAWLIVDTIMRSMLAGTGGVIPGYGPWNRVQCGSQTTPQTVQARQGIAIGLAGVGAWTTNAGGITTSDCDITGVDASGNPIYDCSAQASQCGANGGGTAQVSPDGSQVTCTPNPSMPYSGAACDPLTPITDPAALSMESGSSLIWTNTDPRLLACVTAKGGSPTSAYRPPSYQAHLREVHTKWCQQGLRNDSTSCPAVYAAVQAEMSSHGLSCSRPVAVNSNHSSGIAVDISGAPQNNSNCLTWFGSGDPVHYTLQSGCTCP